MTDQNKQLEDVGASCGTEILLVLPRRSCDH